MSCILGPKPGPEGRTLMVHRVAVKSMQIVHFENLSTIESKSLL